MFFNLLYHPFAWAYDFVAWIVSGGQWQNWVRSTLPLILGERVLELGSGTGVLISALTSAGYSSFAMDESRQFLNVIRHKFRSSSAGISTRLVRARAETLPFDRHSFDTIVATFPSEYILRSDTLASCRRVLRMGGRLVILIGVEIGGEGITRKILRFLYRVTGQTTPAQTYLEQLIEKYADHGFSAHIEKLQYHKDTLTVIVAE